MWKIMRYQFSKANDKYVLCFSGTPDETDNLLTWLKSSEKQFPNDEQFKNQLAFSSSSLRDLHHILYSIPRRVVPKLIK